MVETSAAPVQRDLFTHPVFGSSANILRACDEASLRLLNALLEAVLATPVRVGVDAARDPGVRMLSRLVFRCLDTADLDNLGPRDVELLQAMVEVGQAVRLGAPVGLSACLDRRRIGDSQSLSLDFATNFAPRNGVGAVYEDRMRTEFLAGVPPLRLIPPNDEQVSAVGEGLALMSRAFADRAAECLAHVDFACVMVPENPKAAGPPVFGSVSADEVPRMIILAPHALRSPLTAAEHILHEATHCKLYDLYLTRAIFRGGYAQRKSPTMIPPWRSDDDGDDHPWGVDRTLAAAHVYVHLAALYVALAHDGYVDARSGWDTTARARLCWDRCEWLVHSLDDRGRGELGKDGGELVDWLADLLVRLEPSVVSVESKSPAR